MERTDVRWEEAEVGECDDECDDDSSVGRSRVVEGADADMSSPSEGATMSGAENADPTDAESSACSISTPRPPRTRTPLELGTCAPRYGEDVCEEYRSEWWYVVAENGRDARM